MQMPTLKHIYLTSVLLLVFTSLVAQTPKANNKVSPVQKFVPPKVKTFWGGHNDSASVTVDEAVQLLTFPIKITDDKKNAYGISSYQFLYRKVGVIGAEESESGKTTFSSTVVADLFRTTPLPDIWVKSVGTQLKSGEELYFFDVVAKDAQGHFFFAPTLKIKII